MSEDEQKKHSGNDASQDTSAHVENKTRLSRLANGWQGLVRGGLIALLGGLSAMWISEHYNAPAMLLALLLGLALHFIYEDERIATGINWVAKDVLRIGVALLGLRIVFSDIAQNGIAAPLIILAAMLISFIVGAFGARMLKLRSEFGSLSAGAVAICGVSAAVAIAAVLPRRDGEGEELAIVVVSVTALSTIAMIIYPILSGALNFDDHMAGVFIGGSIHDVAQVVGAGYSISPEAGDTATYIKLMRVALLLPVVIVISAFSTRKSAPMSKGRMLVPLFLVAFFALATVNSFGWVSAPIASLGADLSRTLLVISIFAIGAKSNLKGVMSVGPRPLILILAETIAMAVVIAGALALTRAM